MTSRARLAGHAVHPMLIVFPLGLLETSVVFDAVAMKTRNVRLAYASTYTIGAGIIGGLTAGVFGLWDWLAIPAGTRAKRIGLWHGVGNLIVAGLFSGSWWLRRGRLVPFPSTPAFVLSLVGATLSLVTGWLGGELVERLGVGVDPAASLNASNSLSR